MENSPRSYSPFLPLQLLATFLCLWLAYQVVALNQTRVVAEANLQQLIPQADAALAAKKRLLDLAQDLLQISQKSTAAAQIVKEFEIHVINPETPPASTPAK